MQQSLEFCETCKYLATNEELPEPHFCLLKRTRTEPTYYCKDHSTQTPIGIDDGGTRISYATGAVREPSTGKGRFDLITPFGLQRLAIWYELGAQKYSDRNWEKGIPISRCLDSAFRHLAKYMMGKTDEDHLAAAVWNILAMMHFEEVMPELIDIPARRGESVD